MYWDDPVALVESIVPLPDHMESNFARTKNHRAVQNQRTGEVYAMVSPDYQLLENAVAASEFESRLMDSAIEFNVSTSHAAGGKMIRNYRFPDHQINVGRPDEPDWLELEATMMNSYDTSWQFHINLGAVRLVCTNGMKEFHTVRTVKQKHRREFDFDKITESVINGLSSTQVKLVGFTDMLTDIELTEVQDVGLAIYGKHSSDEDGKPGRRKELIAPVVKGMPQRYKDSVFQRAAQRVADAGVTTGWDLYNDYTYILTHHEMLRDNPRRQHELLSRATSGFKNTALAA